MDTYNNNNKINDNNYIIMTSFAAQEGEECFIRSVWLQAGQSAYAEARLLSAADQEDEGTETDQDACHT